MSTHQSSCIKKVVTMLASEATATVPNGTIKKVLTKEVVIKVTMDKLIKKKQAMDDGTIADAGN
jgi:hypothetical protein